MDMGSYRNLGYGALVKMGVLLGVAMFVVGAGGEWAIHAGGFPLAGWQETLFFDLEALGILLAFVSPIAFGVVLPLVES